MPNFKVTFGLCFNDEVLGEPRESGTYTLVLTAPCQVLAQKNAKDMVGRQVFEREVLEKVISIKPTDDPVTPKWE
jgi:hypothetical protein